MERAARDEHERPRRRGAVLVADVEPELAVQHVLWLHVTREMVFPGRAVARVRTLHQHHTYLVPSDSLRELIMRTVSTERIEDLSLPYAATAMNLLTAEVVHLESGPLVPAVLASAAVPGLYPPVRIDGRDLVDGGVVSNVPVDHALRMGARSLVVLDCGLFGLQLEVPRTLPDTIAHIVPIMIRQQVARDVPEVARRVPVLYPPGPFPLTSSPLEFTASASLMQNAYESTRRFLAEVEPSGPGLYGTPPLVPAPSRSGGQGSG